MKRPSNTIELSLIFSEAPLPSCQTGDGSIVPTAVTPDAVFPCPSSNDQ